MLSKGKHCPTTTVFECLTVMCIRVWNLASEGYRAMSKSWGRQRPHHSLLQKCAWSPVSCCLSTVRMLIEMSVKIYPQLDCNLPVVQTRPLCEPALGYEMNSFTAGLVREKSTRSGGQRELERLV